MAILTYKNGNPGCEAAKYVERYTNVAALLLALNDENFDHEDVDQDWEKGQTSFTFPDGSVLQVSDIQVIVR